MAEEINSYLQYNDGFVLHNGLPVKWLLHQPEWVDYPIIIHFGDDWSGSYKGVTIPNRGTTYNKMPAWSNRIKKTSSGIFLDLASGNGGYCSTGTISVQPTWSATTAANASYPVESYEWQFTSGQGFRTFSYPTSGTSGMHTDHYFGVDATLTRNADLTNHGHAGKSEIIRYYMPDATSLAFTFNASNYSAIRNVYAPNVTNISGWFNGVDENYGTSSSNIKELENITLLSIDDEAVVNDSATRTFGNPLNPVSSVKNVILNGTGGTHLPGYFTLNVADGGIISGFSSNFIYVNGRNLTITSAFGALSAIQGSTADYIGECADISNGTVIHSLGTMRGNNITFLHDEVYGVGGNNPIFTKPNTRILHDAIINGLGNGSYIPSDLATESANFAYLTAASAGNVIDARYVELDNSVLTGNVNNCSTATLKNHSTVMGNLKAADVRLSGGSTVNGIIRTNNLTLDDSFAAGMDTSVTLNSLKMHNSSAASARTNTLSADASTANAITAVSASASNGSILNDCECQTLYTSASTLNRTSAGYLSAYSGELNDCSANSANITCNVSGGFYNSAHVVSPKNLNINTSANTIRIEAYSSNPNNVYNITADKTYLSGSPNSTATISGLSARLADGGTANSGFYFTACNNYIEIYEFMRYTSGVLTTPDGSIPVISGNRTADTSRNNYIKLQGCSATVDGTLNAYGIFPWAGSVRRSISSNVVDYSEVDFKNASDTASGKITVKYGTYIFNSAALLSERLYVSRSVASATNVIYV